MSIKAVVVDDEEIARRRIMRLVGERDDIEVVAQCESGREAVEAINRLRPNLVFLDVQLPDIDGFDVLNLLEVEELPAVIFVTAYDKYALRAFESAAVDYLLKPDDADRFHRAVDRASHWIGTDAAHEEEERLRRLLREVIRSEREAALSAGETELPRLDRFMIKDRGRTRFLRAEEVDWIEAARNYVRLHQGSDSYLVRDTIASCAERLDPRQFVRCHRRYIVNVDRVKEVQPWFGGDSVILLRDGQQLRLSRLFREQFERRMVGTR